MPKIISYDKKIKHAIKINENERYDDFSSVEKFAYKIMKNNLSYLVRKKI